MQQRLVCALSVFLILSSSYAMSQEGTELRPLKISSPVFDNNGQIPIRYGCGGENVNPLLEIENVPSKTKSLALIFDDQDAPKGSYVHWILWNIHPGTKEIKENSVPDGAVQGLNDFKKNKYGGPCPPKRPHRYVFKLYALDVRLQLSSKSTKAHLEKAMKGHIVAQAQLTGVYKRE
jgi:Raf kinase inhibitor-like YbhB/YbcL family protein